MWMLSCALTRWALVLPCGLASQGPATRILLGVLAAHLHRLDSAEVSPDFL